MIKKVTLSLDMDMPTGKKTYEKILNRDRCKYRTIPDFVSAAILAFEGVDAAHAAEEGLFEDIAQYLIEKGYIQAMETKNIEVRKGVPGV